ncbi:unnamed protein product [Phytophthora fragariaefolia]|uniref:Unnamed protein product n=1 Tax=Phytophthora fragariaefolia TaxID=1490495 RepID=A0A9W6Y189_9STRA|nr:unnamed protein product [Phytophthora fragariaefolia]
MRESTENERGANQPGDTRRGLSSLRGSVPQLEQRRRRRRRERENRVATEETMVMTRAGTPTSPPTNTGVARQSKWPRRTRPRLRLDDGAGGRNEVEVSSSIAVAAPGASSPDDDDDQEEGDTSFTDDANWSHGSDGQREVRGDTSHADKGEEMTSRMLRADATGGVATATG